LPWLNHFFVLGFINISTVPLPIGIWLPTITFSVIPFYSSISPNFAAFAIVGTVISKAALARTLSFFPATP